MKSHLFLGGGRGIFYPDSKTGEQSPIFSKRERLGIPSFVSKSNYLDTLVTVLQYPDLSIPNTKWSPYTT